MQSKSANTHTGEIISLTEKEMESFFLNQLFRQMFSVKWNIESIIVTLGWDGSKAFLNYLDTVLYIFGFNPHKDFHKYTSKLHKYTYNFDYFIQRQTNPIH